MQEIPLFLILKFESFKKILWFFYKDMIDKMGSTALLLNGQAVTFLAQARWSSVVDPEWFCPDPDPIFQVASDPDPTL